MSETSKSSSPLLFCNWSGATWAFHLLVLWLALRWLMAGVPKTLSLFGSGPSSASFIAKMFAENEKNWLPDFMVLPYAYAIGPVEAILGVMLLLLILPKLALALTGLTYISLSFGQMVLGNHDKVLDIGLHLVAACIALCLVKYCGVALVPSKESTDG